MKRLVTMRDALSDPDFFATVLPGESWAGWRALLIAMMGEELTEGERVLFAELTGREREPGRMAEEFWAIVGRRGGKTRGASVAATYLATCFDYSDVLAPGERGLVPILSASVDQAAKALSYISGMFAEVPNLAAMKVDRFAETADVIRLQNRIDIQVRPASWRTIRSITAVAGVCDEVAFWRSEETANPDTEILTALRPGLATTGGPLIVISSPHGKRGEVYTTYRQHYGPAGDPLIVVAKAASRTLNPALKQSVVDRAFEKDPASARAEYGGEFRDDLEDFISREVVEALVSRGVKERGRLSGVTYTGFVDPSGASRDSFTMAIGHREDRRAVLDVIRERKPPFSPEEVVAEYAATLKAYGVTSVTGDRYAGEWPREAFRKHGVTYVAAAKPKSDLYRDLLPRLNSGQVDILDEPRLISQLCGLERRTARGGRDSIDHPPSGHDDLANAAAGCLTQVLDRPRYGLIDMYGSMTPEERAEEGRALQQLMRAQHIGAFG